MLGVSNRKPETINVTIGKKRIKVSQLLLMMCSIAHHWDKT